MTVEKVPFGKGDLVVYPTHGVGKITTIEMQEIAGHTLSVIAVSDKTTCQRAARWPGFGHMC
jgi:RNA polymerase-interacting CarD/CdnL/TRCF family regulator